MENLAQQVIDAVHGRWAANNQKYPAGYAVFYSALRESPTLLLLGLNPGGDERDFSGEKERVRSRDESMEYVKYGCENGYRLAQKTVQLFESIGKKDLLRGSVKTNLNFFRSKKWVELGREDARFCENLAFKVIRDIRPKVLFCESLFVFDSVLRNLYKGIALKSLQHYSRGKRRKYESYLTNASTLPRLIIGITHLTGSRPSREDMEEIGRRLREDLESLD